MLRAGQGGGCGRRVCHTCVVVAVWVRQCVQEKRDSKCEDWRVMSDHEGDGRRVELLRRT